eukprot:5473460-Amphidinium_carterae.1
MDSTIHATMRMSPTNQNSQEYLREKKKALRTALNGMKLTTTTTATFKLLFCSLVRPTDKTHLAWPQPVRITD